MSYLDRSELRRYLLRNRGKAWPLVETCVREEAERRALVHRDAYRVVVDEVGPAGERVGYASFNDPDGCAAAIIGPEEEQRVLIMFAG